MALNLQRNTRVFFSTRNLAGGDSAASMIPINTWEISILAGSTISYTGSTVVVSAFESGRNPDRGSTTFLTSTEPVSYSFTSYLRTTDAAYMSIDGDIKPIADWFMWQSLTSNNSVANLASTWTYGGNLLIGTQSAKYRSGASTVNYVTPPENHIYFVLDNVVYQAQSATVDSLTLDAAISAIATSTWSGQARALVELTDSNRDNAISVFGGVLSDGTVVTANAITASSSTASSYHPYSKMTSSLEYNNAYIKNRMSEIVINYGGTTYNLPVTGISFNYANNNKYLTPETIGIVNAPIGVMTGARVISGSATTYLRDKSSPLVKAILSNTSPSSASFASATLYIGGNTYPRVAISIPAVTFDFPSIVVDDIIATTFNWTAQQPAKTTGEQVLINAAQRGSSDESIADMFTSASSGVWYDFRDKSYLYQDSAGTVPVTAAGQPVGRVLDKGGNNAALIQPTSTKRPIYTIRPNIGVRNLAVGSGATTSTTYWPASAVGNGITATKMGTGIDTDGLPYVDYRYTATLASGAGLTTTYSYPNANNPATAGDIFTVSGYAQVVGGTLTSISAISLSLFEQTAPNTTLFSYPSSGLPTIGGPAIRLTATSAAVTTGNQIGMRVNISASAGTIDVTIRWKGIQLERGSSATAWQQSLGPYEVYESNSYAIAGLTADGIDDALYSEANISLSSTASLGVIVNAIKASDASTGVLLEFSSNVLTSNGSFAIVGSDSGNYWTSYVRGTSVGTANVTSTTYSAGKPVVIETNYGILASNHGIRPNVTFVTTTSTDLGTSNFGSYPLYVFSRANTVLPFGGFSTGVYVRNTSGNRTGPAYQFLRDIGVE